jgi:uncharacterized membrane protein
MIFDLKSLWMFTHFLGLTAFLGGQIYYLLILQPASYQFHTTHEQIAFFQNTLKRQSPILLFAVCLLAVSGGLMVTGLKGQLGGSYLQVFGGKLLIKFILFFLTFFLSAYQALSVGFLIRFLDPANQTEKIDFEKKLSEVRKKMTITSIFAIGFILAATYVARL